MAAYAIALPHKRWTTFSKHVYFLKSSIRESNFDTDT